MKRAFPPASGMSQVHSALSPLHRLWRLLPSQPRRTFLTYSAARLAPSRSRPPTAPRDGIIIGGEVSQASGLGEAARIIAAGLVSIGVPSWLIEAGVAVPGRQPDEAPPTHELATLPPAAPLVLCVNAPQFPAALLQLRRASLKGRLIVGFWNWELPVLPNTWRPALDLVHEVWVPSAFVADAVARILPRTNAPVLRVIPYPLAASPLRPAAMDRAVFGLPERAMIVLTSFNLASSLERKNPLGAIAAFRAAFGDRADRILVLKIGKPDHYPADLDAIQSATGGAANIRIETRTFPSAERHALTACADIVLALHRSEGFGLVPAEAMLLGKPVVATNWSGNLAFMDASCAALVGFRLVPVVDPRGTYTVSGARWAEPDLKDAAERLRHLGDDADARASLGARGQAAAAARLGTAKLSDAVRALGLTSMAGLSR